MRFLEGGISQNLGQGWKNRSNRKGEDRVGGGWRERHVAGVVHLPWRLLQALAEGRP